MTLSYSSTNAVKRKNRPSLGRASTSLREAVAVEKVSDEQVVAEVHEGWDVFGVPHGGYLTAMAANAVLCASGRPDLFTISVHFLRKAALGPMRWSVHAVGASRRLSTFTAVGRQKGKNGDQVVVSAMASVGDASTLPGPAWSDRPPPEGMALHDVTADDDASFSPPNIARAMRLKLDPATLGFAEGLTGDRAEIRGVADIDDADVLAALVVCDLTPPAIWNALGARGWVPTVELTAHVRQRPAPGPLVVSATTREMTTGFLDEDALVHDAEGRLIVQSRQLARWSGT